MVRMLRFRLVRALVLYRLSGRPPHTRALALRGCGRVRRSVGREADGRRPLP